MVGRPILYFRWGLFFLFLVHGALSSVEKHPWLTFSKGLMSFSLNLVNGGSAQFVLMLFAVSIELTLGLEVLAADVAFD